MHAPALASEEMTLPDTIAYPEVAARRLAPHARRWHGHSEPLPPSSSLVVTDDDSALACRLTYTASDHSAIAQSGQSCTIGSAFVTVQDGSLQLEGSSLSASVHQSIEAGGPPAEDESLDYTGCSRKKRGGGSDGARSESRIDITAGFYSRLNALKGHNRTFYTGAAFQTNDSSPIWRFTQELLLQILA